MRAILKAKEHGLSSLTDDERALYDDFREGVRAELAALPPGWAEDAQRALDMYEHLSPEDQMRYGDWTPRQLLAFLPLLDLKFEDE